MPLQEHQSKLQSHSAVSQPLRSLRLLLEVTAGKWVTVDSVQDCVCQGNLDDAVQSIGL